LLSHEQKRPGQQKDFLQTDKLDYLNMGLENTLKGEPVGGCFNQTLIVS
jgi:hypothetical protein